MTTKSQESIKGKNVLTVRVSDEFYEFMNMISEDTDTNISQHIRAALLMYAEWLCGESYSCD